VALSFYPSTPPARADFSCATWATRRNPWQCYSGPSGLESEAVRSQCMKRCRQTIAIIAICLVQANDLFTQCWTNPSLRQQGHVMELVELAIPGPILIKPRRHADDRGHFSETFRQDIFGNHVPGVHFIQDNQSISFKTGTVRGLHFQRQPRAQGKLIRVVRGRIFDVVIDARGSSPFYRQNVSVELSAENGHQLWVPQGFLHGFCTLEPNTEVAYKVTDYYSAEHDGAVRWNDPDLAVNWPVDASTAILSDKDLKAPLFKHAGTLF
jgi:dTDP-4-dehydrorhamnose 3,5-epimerase